MKRLPILLTAVVLLAGCAGQTRLESDLGIKGAPDWVNKGTAYVGDDGGRRFHGVGSAGPMGDASLQRAVADDRARAELAKIFSAYMDVVGTDYQSAARASGGAAAADEAVSRQIRALSQVNLTGARIVARWVDEKQKTVWSIAEIDLKQVKDTAAVAAGMNTELQRYVGAQADNVFDRVAKGGR
jgi:hypothetical protein